MLLYEFEQVNSNNKIAVRVYNPNSITVSVGLTKIGYNCSNNYDVACETYGNNTVSPQLILVFQ